MFFNCSKEVLLNSLITAQRAVSSKNTIPAVEGFLIRASNDGIVYISGYDLEMGIQTCFEADSIQVGSIVVNARLLYDIVRSLPDDIISFQENDLAVTVKGGKSVFNLMGIPAQDFPELPVLEDENRLISLPQSLLRNMIYQTVFAVSQNQNKPIHTGSLFEVENGKLRIVSLDGFRLALREEDVIIPGVTEPFSFVVPGKALKEVEKILSSDEDKTLTIYLGRRHILFNMGSTSLICRLLEGEFLNYRNAIPKRTDLSILVGVSEVCRSLERVSLIINERLKSPVKIQIDDSIMKLSCMTGLGRAYDELQVEPVISNKIEMAFNERYILDAVKVVEEDQIIWELTNNISPCVIKPVEGNKYLFLVLPVRLKDE